MKLIVRPTNLPIIKAKHPVPAVKEKAPAPAVRVLPMVPAVILSKPTALMVI